MLSVKSKKIFPVLGESGGFSLVELMVAITIGSFILLLVGQVFYNNKTVYRSQTAQAELQEKGRFLMHWVAGQLRQAGYVDTSRVTNTMAVNFTASGTAFPVAGVVVRDSSGVINYRYYGNSDNQIVDCNGAAASGGLNYSQIAQASGSITCSSAGAASQQVMSNVGQLVMNYGIDTATGATDRVPDSYVVATGVSDWSRVFSVRVCAVVESDTQYVAPSGYSFTDCNGNSYTPLNGRLGKVFRTTVYLRNNLP